MEDGSYTGVVRDKIINARQESNQLILQPVSLSEVENHWLFYFDLQRNYGAVNRQILEQAPWMKAPLQTGKGIRLLRQDPWETTITFILSSNNHIPRITGSVACLSETYGNHIATRQGVRYHSFPTSEQLKKLSLEQWQACGAGYRARYLMQAALQWETCYRQIRQRGTDPGDIDEKTARCLLETLPGVGPKVSACISLFSLDQRHQFPVDVWVRRRVKELWSEAPSSDREMEVAALKLFGDEAGYAQQLIFYNARKGKSAS